MNKVLQRIAIAESQGWKHVICSVGEHGTMMSGWWMPCGALTTDINMLPDYLNDLNAMHEAEKFVKNVWGKYVKILNSFTDPACATAANRAEAFGLTLGLWTE